MDGDVDDDWLNGSAVDTMPDVVGGVMVLATGVGGKRRRRKKRGGRRNERK